MMKKIGWIVLALLLFAAAAGAQTLPSNDVFSPGLVRLAELEKTQPPVEARMTLDVRKAMYARDLSLLGDLLEGATIAYNYDDGGETLAIERNGETLGVYAVEQSDALDALAGRLLGVAVLERVKLARIADWLEGLRAGDALAFGFAVSEPFALTRTMSDDGTRLTKIAVTGAIAREGEAPWKVKGYLRQPAGRAPKDTFELTFTQDEDNAIELLYSALRENEITRKNKEGTASVRTTLKAAGKLGGYGVSTRLTVTMKNRWTADGEALGEKISITASLGHTDRTPGRRMQRLNDLSAENKHVIRLTTHEGGDDVIGLSDEMTLEVILDGNTFLSGEAQMTVQVGAEAEKAPCAPVEPIGEQAIRLLAKKLYQQLEDTSTIREGL